MPVIPAIIPDKQLQLEYNVAKIKADPYNYTLTDRVLFYEKGICFSKYNIFGKGNNTEIRLCDLLKLKFSSDYMCQNLKIDAAEADAASSINEYSVEVCRDRGGFGIFIKYNNLIINEEILINDYSFKNYPVLLNFGAAGRELCSKGYLKALEYLFTKCISKSSLIPNLFYLATNLNNYSLSDLENIKFASDALAKGIAPLVPNIGSSIDKPNKVGRDRLLELIAVPNLDMYSLFTKDKDFGNDSYRIGLCYALLYGAEVLYNVENISDSDIKILIEDLFSIMYDENSFCADYLYKINDAGHLEINADLISCFDNDNEQRFNKFKLYFDKICPTLNCDIVSKYTYYKMPVMFATFIQDMHGYAYQVCRVKHAIFIYKEAKAKGVLEKELFEQETLGGLGGGLFGAGSEDEPISELLDLDSISVKGSNEMSSEEFIEQEKNVTDMQKSKAPQLNTMDALAKDLYDSRYDFDIKYVKNDVSNRDAYYTIANNIKMLAHSLAKQIKEIRTYNTGGKQSGLFTGKLDKKNLYKYKTDPKIFCNNNYKIKEMDLAFGCVLDESGSMYGEKIKNGRIVMILLHEVLTSLGINHSIIGHSSEGTYQSIIYKYYQFKEEAYFSLEKPYNLVTASARSCNCDSGALYYMQKVIKRVQNKDKIVIIFSDGQPTECTDLDLVNQVKAMEKDGIHVIGVGINFEAIKDYYPDNANGKNLKEMVDIVVSILKRYVLEKKED